MTAETTHSNTEAVDDDRRNFIHIATGAVALGGAGMFAWAAIDQWNPAADTKAASSLDVDVDAHVDAVGRPAVAAAAERRVQAAPALANKVHAQARAAWRKAKGCAGVAPRDGRRVCIEKVLNQKR